MTIAIGDKVTDMELLITGDKTIKLTDFSGKKVVLFFYPKANTPGCTTEGKDFRDAFEQFNELNTVVLGASRDGIKAQENFKAKHEFPYDLISDKPEEFCNAFDVIKLKKLYGKESMGIERSTFLIDEEGKLIHEWRKVKVKEHVEDVLNTIKSL